MEADMGSFRHPKVYEPVLLQSIRATFYDIMEALDGQGHGVLTQKSLKANIIEQLLFLAMEDTPQNEWKAKVLSSLPLR
jgi:hypothetical protein